jgi:hypothetical protein
MRSLGGPSGSCPWLAFAPRVTALSHPKCCTLVMCEGAPDYPKGVGGVRETLFHHGPNTIQRSGSPADEARHHLIGGAVQPIQVAHDINPVTRLRVAR